MSWDAYVSDQLVGSGNVCKAAICGADGSVWAKSSDWEIEPAEITKITTGFSNTQNFASTGIVLAGIKYFFIGGTDTSVRIKKGTGGVHITKTKTAFIFGMYEEPTMPGQCASTVETLADYLVNSNF